MYKVVILFFLAGAAWAGLPVAIYFSPGGGCTEAVVRELGRATNSLQVQAYSFTSAPIAQAVLDAQKRGVQVAVILDKSQRTQKYSSATFFRNSGVPTYIDDKHAIAHNKIMIIDGQTVITGSFNFTKAAEEKNAENLLVIHDRTIALQYTTNWQAHAVHSAPDAIKAIKPPRKKAASPPSSSARKSANGQKAAPKR